MPKAVITILGTIGCRKSDDKQEWLCSIKPDGRAIYRTELDFVRLHRSDKKYTNTLPLLIEAFSKEYEIIPIATKDAKIVQTKVLQEIEYMNGMCLQNAVFIDDDDFYGVFKVINEAMGSYDEVIFDVSHGFRHLPIMATIALISQNIITPTKISHILFAQEVEQFKEYKIIDLAEYLDIATVSYRLASFNKNYTAVNSTLLRTDKFKPLLESLEDFSEHILANSIQMIFDKRLAHTIIEQIEVLERNTSISSLSSLLTKIKSYLSTIDKLGELDEYQRLFRLGKILLDRGYLLNAITLLVETCGYYAAHSFVRNGGTDLKAVMSEAFRAIKTHSHGFHGYHLVSGVLSFFVPKNDMKNFLNPNGNRLQLDKNLVLQASMEAKAITAAYGEDKKEFTKLYEHISELRNNLAHANSSKAITDTKSSITALYDSFEDLCITKDVFCVQNGTLIFRIPTYESKIDNPVLRVIPPKITAKKSPTGPDITELAQIVIATKAKDQPVQACNYFVAYIRKIIKSKAPMFSDNALRAIRAESWLSLSKKDFGFLSAQPRLVEALKNYAKVNEKEYGEIMSIATSFYSYFDKNEYTKASIIAVDFLKNTHF